MRRISNFRHKCSQSLSVVKQTLFPLPLVIFAINIDDSAGVFADCPTDGGEWSFSKTLEYQVSSTDDEFPSYLISIVSLAINVQLIVTSYWRRFDATVI